MPDRLRFAFLTQTVTDLPIPDRSFHINSANDRAAHNIIACSRLRSTALDTNTGSWRRQHPENDQINGAALHVANHHMQHIYQHKRDAAEHSVENSQHQRDKNKTELQRLGDADGEQRQATGQH